MPHVLIITPDRRQRRLWIEWMAGYPDILLREAASLEEGLAGPDGPPDVIVAPLAHGHGLTGASTARLESTGLVFVADDAVPFDLLPTLESRSPGSPRPRVMREQDGASSLIEAVESLLDLRQRHREQAMVEACCTKCVLEYEIDNDKSRIGPLIELLLKRCDQFDLFDDRDRVRTQIALEETLLNAVIHGNLEVDSKLREEAGDEFGRMIALRQSIPHFADRRVTVRCELDRQGATFTIRDEGPGFDVSRIRDCRDTDRLSVASGRGLLLIRSFMDQVTHNATGNEVQLQKGRSSSKVSTACEAEAGHAGATFTATR